MSRPLATLTCCALVVAMAASTSNARPQRLSSAGLLEPSRDSGSISHLLAARSSAVASRYRDTLDQLGLAETRLLNDRSAAHGQSPDSLLHRALIDVAAARSSAARQQRFPTIDAINDALLSLERAAQPRAAATFAAPFSQPSQFQVLPEVAPDGLPTSLYRLEPGHWQLQGAESVWVPPQSVPQPVSVQPIVSARRVWDGDRWVLVPEHFAGSDVSQ